MVLASTRPGEWCLDPFAGSGTLGAVATATGRNFVLIDTNPQAVEVAARRLAPAPVRRPAPRMRTSRDRERAAG